jgi:hypothetical protein
MASGHWEVTHRLSHMSHDMGAKARIAGGHHGGTRQPCRSIGVGVHPFMASFALGGVEARLQEHRGFLGTRRLGRVSDNDIGFKLPLSSEFVNNFLFQRVHVCMSSTAVNWSLSGCNA